jgi:enoyl-CoA hydratase/carnithine racemase
MFLDGWERRREAGYETFVVEQGGAVATVTLNRPEARNALDFAMRGELLAALVAAFFDKRPPNFKGA